MKSVSFVLTRVLLILAGVLFALIALEGALRVLPIPSRQALAQRLEEQWESDPELLLRLKPDFEMEITGHPEFSYTLKTNSDGLRDEPFTGTFDIAAVGDSFTFGFGVEQPESWPAQLETLSGKRVANLGWAGWSSYVYPVALERYAVPLETKLWLWAFFYNDLPESAGAEEFIQSGEPDYLSWIREQQPRPGFPYNLRVLEFLLALTNPELFLLPNSGDREFDNGEFKMRVGSYSWDVSDPENPQVQRGWELTEQALEQAHDLAMQNGAELVIVFVPSREHVYWPIVKQSLPEFDVDQLDAVSTRLRDIATTQGLHYLDLLPGFRAAADAGEMLYFPSDGHWNPPGHQLAANLIHQFLLEQELYQR